MKKSWVIIWVSSFTKEEKVYPGVYLDYDVAWDDKEKLDRTEPYWKGKFHVVEYGSKEYRNALMQNRAEAL